MIKFIHVDNYIDTDILSLDALVGGYYNWHRVFNGEFKLFNDVKHRLNDYDIVFNALCRFNIQARLPQRIKERLTGNTKLVVSVDYAVELWKNTINPLYVKDALEAADMVIVPEPALFNYVASLLGKTDNVHICQHPSDIDNISKYYTPTEDRYNDIVTYLHSYESNWLTPYLVTRELDDVRTIAVSPLKELGETAMPFYEYVMSVLSYPKYLEWVGKKKIYLESYHTVHSYGRSQVEMAVLGLPSVGSDNIYLQKLLFPETTTKPHETFAQTEIIKKLLSDESFYRRVVNYAQKKVKQFSYENKKQELLTLIKDGFKCLI